jgi:hypothetical protein
MYAGKMNKFHRSFLGHQERILSASKILHLLHQSRSRHAAAVVEVREGELTAEEAEAPAIQVSETPNFHREDRHLGASSRQFQGRENRRRFL